MAVNQSACCGCSIRSPDWAWRSSGQTPAFPKSGDGRKQTPSEIVSTQASGGRGSEASGSRLGDEACRRSSSRRGRAGAVPRRPRPAGWQSGRAKQVALQPLAADAFPSSMAVYCSSVSTPSATGSPAAQSRRACSTTAAARDRLAGQPLTSVDQQRERPIFTTRTVRAAGSRAEEAGAEIIDRDAQAAPAQALQPPQMQRSGLPASAPIRVTSDAVMRRGSMPVAATTASVPAEFERASRATTEAFTATPQEIVEPAACHCSCSSGGGLQAGTRRFNLLRLEQRHELGRRDGAEPGKLLSGSAFGGIGATQPHARHHLVVRSANWFCASAFPRWSAVARAALVRRGRYRARSPPRCCRRGLVMHYIAPVVCAAAARCWWLCPVATPRLERTGMLWSSMMLLAPPAHMTAHGSGLVVDGSSTKNRRREPLPSAAAVSTPTSSSTLVPSCFCRRRANLGQRQDRRSMVAVGVAARCLGPAFVRGRSSSPAPAASRGGRRLHGGACPSRRLDVMAAAGPGRSSGSKSAGLLAAWYGGSDARHHQRAAMPASAASTASAMAEARRSRVTGGARRMASNEGLLPRSGASAASAAGRGLSERFVSVRPAFARPASRSSSAALRRSLEQPMPALGLGCSAYPAGALRSRPSRARLLALGGGHRHSGQSSSRAGTLAEPDDGDQALERAIGLGVGTDSSTPGSRGPPPMRRDYCSCRR